MAEGLGSAPATCVTWGKWLAGLSLPICRVGVIRSPTS